MRSLFQTDDYRAFLHTFVYSDDAKRGLQTQLAKAMGCQASYLSQVIKGKAELTEDHALKLAHFLEFTGSATNYFLVLVRHSRASSPELKKFLELERQKILLENDKILSRSQASETAFSDETLYKYFSSWIPSTVHMATSSENFQTIETLAKRLRLSPAKIEKTLQFLDEIGAVKRQAKKWVFAGTPMHIGNESPVNFAHQSIRRAQALRALEDGDLQDIHFSTIFTVSNETANQLRTDILDLIERSHKKIQSSGSDELHSICVDLFRVI